MFKNYFYIEGTINAMKIFLSEVDDIHKRLNEINAIPLKDIEWCNDDGTICEFSEELLNEWKFVGLSNTYFALYQLIGENNE